ENRKRRLRAVQQRIPGTIELLVLEHVEDATIRFLAERPHGFATGPRRRCAPRRIVLARIDAASKQLLEMVVDAGTSERFLDERVEAEGRQMSFVEHDRVALSDRAVVVRIGGEEV